MKKLTITVPCFNAEMYLKRCLDSLVIGGNDVEIIVVDDGSTDRTGEIADQYVSEYPDIVKAVHKENGGHGSGVNTGLRMAAGAYFKVVDSDDWLEEKAYKKLLKNITQWLESAEKGEAEMVPDLVICNYVYNHLEEEKTKIMHYRNVFPVNKFITWNDMGAFYPSQYLIMHALIYRTEILRKSGVILPEHTFYVDNIFAYYPLPFVKTLCYLDEELYNYYLGREDQSVNEKVLISRIEQQIKVTKIVAECVDLKKVKEKR